LNKRIICLCLSAVMMLSFAGCKKKAEDEVAANATNVTVSVAKEQDISNIITYTGELKAAEDASVSSKIAAKIRAIHVDIGDYVQAGTVLATLDGTDYQNAYNQALAGYNSAVAAYNNVANGSSEQSKISVNQALANAQTAYDNALADYNRQKQLYDIGAISQVAFDACKTQLDTAKLALDTAQQNHDLTVDVVAPGSVKSAQASMESAKAALDTARSNLGNTSITAPISGYVASNNAKIGQMATAGVELFAISNSKSVDVEVNVTASVIPYIEVGTPAKISVKSADIENIEGTVTVASPVKNPKTGMYTVRVTIDNEEGKLMVGMPADITLTTDTAANAVAIPSEALLEDSEGTTYVYIANGNKAERKDVEIGIEDTEFTQVISGIKAGDKVIVTGKEYLSEKNNDINITEEK